MVLKRPFASLLLFETPSLLIYFCCRCVLGDGVQIQDNTQLPPETWLVSQKPDSGFSDDEEETENDNDTIYGAKAIVFKEEDEDDDEDSDQEIEGKGGFFFRK